MTDRPTSFPEARLPSDGVGGSSSVSPPRGKPKRRPVPPHMLVTVAILQAGSIRCVLCNKPLTADMARVLEHMTPVALGGGNTIDNLRWVHRPCADRKTNGTPATAASGDLHKIAKAKRLDRAREAHRAVLAGERKREPGKIKGRGFDKTLRRKMNGAVTRREPI